MLVSVVLLATAVINPFAVSAFSHEGTRPLPSGLYKSWKQKDPRWSDVVIGIDPWADANGVIHEEETVGHAGCLITSMAILARAYGLTLKDGTAIDPGTLAEAMYDGGSCRYLTEKGGARYGTAFDELIPGITFEEYIETDDPLNTAAALLSDPETEYLIIFGVKNKGHYVAADHVEDGEVIICDPGYDNDRLSAYRDSSCMLVFAVDEAYVDKGVILPTEPFWKVIDAVKLRSAPGLNGEVLGVLPVGTTFTVTETQEADGYLWGKLENGWCALRTLDGVEPYEEYCVYVEGTQYAVTYHGNGGIGVPETQYKQYGVPINLSETEPTKEGFLFLGWSKDPSAVSAQWVPNEEYTTDAPMSLYAVWMPESQIALRGIDASRWQGDVDWEAVAADGVEFVILRAGTSYGKDTRFEEYYAAATEAGLHIGSYFYTYASNEEEAIKDAELFLDCLSGKQFDMPVYLDVENENQKGLSVKELSAMVCTVLEILREQGYYCGVYASESWYENRLDAKQFGERENLWVAKWSSSGRLTQNMSELYGMHQYSDSGHVDGIDGRVDLDVCFIDYPTLLAGYNGNTDPHPLEESKLRIVNGCLIGGKPRLTVAEWGRMFDGGVQFYDSDGNLLADTDEVYTGCTVHCGKRIYDVSVLGDLNGDGDVDALDYIRFRRAFFGIAKLDNAQLGAALFSGEQMRAVDFIRLKRHVMGIIDLYASFTLPGEPENPDEKPGEEQPKPEPPTDASGDNSPDDTSSLPDAGKED